MLEIPEAKTITRQMSDTLMDKRITHAIAATSPHGFAWYSGDPAMYTGMLTGRTITGTATHGGRPELWAEDMRISFGDGVNIRYIAEGAKRPAKHQLLLTFDSGDALVCTVQMYGGMWAFPAGTNDDFYYTVGVEKPNPLDDAFDAAYFASLLTDEIRKLSAKAFLATQQRVPGLGNGVVQDILWTAQIHPKRKMHTLSDADFQRLFDITKTLLKDMTAKGGRNTEKDLFGQTGSYITIMSKNNTAQPCPACGDIIKRMSYLGGNVYVCETCQSI